MPTWPLPIHLPGLPPLPLKVTQLCFLKGENLSSDKGCWGVWGLKSQEALSDQQASSLLHLSEVGRGVNVSVADPTGQASPDWSGGAVSRNLRSCSNPGGGHSYSASSPPRQLELRHAWGCGTHPRPGPQPSSGSKGPRRDGGWCAGRARGLDQPLLIPLPATRCRCNMEVGHLQRACGPFPGTLPRLSH